MKVTIDGITYEGSPAEIRDIVENPPKANDRHVDCPDNDRWNYPRREPYFPNPIMTWWDEAPGIQRNWDGSPRVTCDDGAYRRHATNCSMDNIVSAFLSDQAGL